MTMTNKIGIMGGTFDPIHFGHLLAAEESHRELGLSEVVFVPTGYPPHKDDLAGPEHRYAMTLLATAGISYFSVSRMEIDRKASSHTVDTLREFKKFSGDEAELFFITGLDAILSISTWKDYLLLPGLCRLVTVTRPGYSQKGLHELPQPIRDSLIFVEIPQFSVSSTDVRQRICEGKSAKYLVPDAVEDYIKKCHLYRRKNQ